MPKRRRTRAERAKHAEAQRASAARKEGGVRKVWVAIKESMIEDMIIAGLLPREHENDACAIGAAIDASCELRIKPEASGTPRAGAATNRRRDWSED